MEQKTKVWERYERGRNYNNRLTPNQYSLVNTNIEFFAGNQWLHLAQTPAMQKLPKPTFNIIKRVASLFVASLTASNTSIRFDELSYYAGEPLSGGQVGRENVNGAAIATAEVENLLEKFKMDYRIREALFDGAQTGDYCAHFYWNPEAVPYGGAFGPYKGAIEMELVDGINVMFGNPNDPCVENQPYILIVGRDTTKNLEEEAKYHRTTDGEIQPDGDNLFQAAQGGQIELESGDKDGKTLFAYMYEKKTKEVVVEDEFGKPVTRQVTTVHVTKATKTCTIFEDVDTGLSRYPIAWGNWEKQKNQYHGRALVTGVIPNQIFINSMFAMVMRHLQLMGFPKTVYNADLISQWTNEVGQAIAVRGLQPGQSVTQAACNLQPADMSNQIIQAIDKAVAYTKDCLGATDAQLGNVKPENTSALMVLQSSAEVPLENTRAGLYEWMEDIGAILLDMIGTYYGKRPIVRDREFSELVLDPNTGMPVLNPMTGMMMTNKVIRRVMVTYDFTQFKNLWFNVRVDAGAATRYSEIAMVQTLDNLRRDGTLEVIDYLERIPDKLIPRKAELIQSLRTRVARQEGSPTAGSVGGYTIGGPLSEKNALAKLPTGVQSRYQSLPRSVQRSLRQLGNLKA